MPAESVEVRLADESEREAVFRLRHDIYVEELGLRHLASGGDDRMYDEEDGSGRLLVAVADGRVAGSMRLNLGADAPVHASFRRDLQLDPFLEAVPEERVMICSRFVVSSVYRGSLVPFQLFARAAEEAASEGVELVFCDCQPHLIRLYYALGFRSYGRVYSPHGWGIKVPLVLLGGDVEHMRAISSPLLGLDLEFPVLSEATRRAAALLPREPVVRPRSPLDLGRRAQEGPLQLLRGLEPDEIRSVAEHSYVIALERGTQLISKGQVTRTVFLVLEGQLEACDGEHSVRSDAHRGHGRRARLPAPPPTHAGRRGELGARVGARAP